LRRKWRKDPPPRLVVGSRRNRRNRANGTTDYRASLSYLPPPSLPGVCGVCGGRAGKAQILLVCPSHVREHPQNGEGGAQPAPDRASRGMVLNVDYVGVGVFGLYLAIYLLMLGAYAWTTVMNASNLYVAARQPQLLLVELLLNAYISCCVGGCLGGGGSSVQYPSFWRYRSSIRTKRLTRRTTASRPFGSGLCRSCKPADAERYSPSPPPPLGSREANLRGPWQGVPL
jgi:hypothetical protein